MKSYLAIVIIGVLPFFPAQAMPGWRSLAGYAVLFAASFGALYSSWGGIIYPAGDGPGGGLAAAFASLSAGLGFVSGVVGILTRAVTLHLRARSYRLGSRVAVAVVGFLLIFPIAWSPFAWQKWTTRPPPSYCRSDTMVVAMGALRFEFPTLPIIRFSTGTGDEPAGSLDHYFGFLGNKGLRKFCWHYDNGRAEVAPNFLSISFGKVGRDYRLERYQELCRNSASAWPKELCVDNFEAAQSLPFPAQLHLYLAGKYNARRMIVSQGSTYDWIQNIDFSNSHASTIPGMRLFDGKYYWIGDWKTPDGKPFAMSCGRPPYVAWLGCQAGYAIADGVFVDYRFRVRDDALRTDAKKIYDSVSSFLKTMQVPQRPPNG